MLKHELQLTVALIQLDEVFCIAEKRQSSLGITGHM